MGGRQHSRSHSLIVIALVLMLSVGFVSVLANPVDKVSSLTQIKNSSSSTPTNAMSLGDSLSGSTVTIYYFWAIGCPHCALTEPFIDSMDAKYPQINILRLEITKNATNLQLYVAFNEKWGTVLTTPSAFTDTNEPPMIGMDAVINNLESTILRLIGPPAAPENLEATGLDTNVVLTWNAANDNGGAPVINYAVYRGTATNGETLLTTLGNVLTYTDTGLINGQTYFYNVSAVSSVGEGDRSVEVSATPARAPSAPTLDSAMSGDRHIVLVWIAPSNTGGAPVIKYAVYRGTATNGETLLTTLGNVLTYDSTGLTNGVTYYYKVSALNSAGEGVSSNELSATPAGVPSAPTLDSVNSVNSQVVLAWSAPASDGYASITGYKVYRATTSGGEVLLATTGNVLTYTDTGVINGTTYYYEISTVNSIGEGAKSNELSARPAGSPTAPQNLQASPRDTYINLTWQEPANDGGSPITNYAVLRGTSAGTETSLVDTGTTHWYNNTGLNNGQTYYYVVEAKNVHGVSPSSNEVSAMPWHEPAVPTEPQILTAIAGNGYVVLTWFVPANDGGSVVTNYTIYRGMASGPDVLLTTIGSVLNYTDTGLINGQTYYYEVHAVNAVGEGAESKEASATPVTVPIAPTPDLVTPGDARIAITWFAPSSDGGAPIIGYVVYRGTVSGEETRLTTLGNVLTYTNSGLVNGQTYYYEVSVLNLAGEGPRSMEVSATPAGIPTDPTIISASPGNGQIVLSWSAPASDGGSAITAYNVYRGNAPGMERLYTIIGNVLTYTDTNLTNGQTYYYNVSAVSLAGEGVLSVEISATPVSVPSAPTITTTTPKDGYIVISWTAPSYSGPGKLIYHLFRDGIEIWNGTGTEHIDPGLTNGVTYSYSLAVSNSIGLGPISSTVQVTPSKSAGDSTDLTVEMVIVAAAIDSINPCAISVLIFLLLFLTSLGNKRRVLFVGIAYIVTVYVVYFMAGVGLLTLLESTAMTRYVYYAAALLSIIIGILNIKDFVLPGNKPTVAIPESRKPFIKKYIEKASIPAAVVLGGMVSLFELPCTGSIYLAILSLLGNKMTAAQGIPYLALYNLIFVLPLVIILGIIYLGVSAEKANSWRLEKRKSLRLIIGLVMLLLGAMMLFGVI